MSFAAMYGPANFADMEANNITAAPQVTDVSALYDVWRETNLGNKADFYKFLTTPGTERDEFFNVQPVELSFSGSVLMVVAKS